MQQLLLSEKIQALQTKIFCVHDYKYQTIAIESMEQEGLKKETQWREQLDGFARDKLEASLQENPNIVEFVISTELQFRVNTKFAHLSLWMWIEF